METLEINGRKYVTASELARAHNLKRQGIYNLVRAGKIESESFATLRLIPFSIAETWQPAPRGRVADKDKVKTG